MADAGPIQDHGLEARVARLESDVGHIRSDVADIKSTLNRLAPAIDEMRGFLAARLPELATKAELNNLRAETKAGFADLRAGNKGDLAQVRAETQAEFVAVRREMVEFRLEVVQRPTRRQSIFGIFAIAGLVGAVPTISARFAH